MLRYTLKDAYTTLADSLLFKKLWGTLISSWEQKVYCKNTAKCFWLIFNSKPLAFVTTFSLLIPETLVSLDLKKQSY